MSGLQDLLQATLSDSETFTFRGIWWKGLRSRAGQWEVKVWGKARVWGWPRVSSVPGSARLSQVGDSSWILASACWPRIEGRIKKSGIEWIKDWIFCTSDWIPLWVHVFCTLNKKYIMKMCSILPGIFRWPLYSLAGLFVFSKSSWATVVYSHVLNQEKIHCYWNSLSFLILFSNPGCKELSTYHGK